MTADTPKVARSTHSQNLLCRLVREIDYAEAYRAIRCLAPNSGESLPATEDVIVWVIDLMRLRDAVLAGHMAETVRDLAEKCGKPTDDDEDDSPMDVSNEALEYLEHSTELPDFDLVRRVFRRAVRATTEELEHLAADVAEKLNEAETSRGQRALRKVARP